jgi:hypothetical protein
MVAFIKDLKKVNKLDDTLLIPCSEFGRLIAQKPTIALPYMMYGSKLKSLASTLPRLISQPVIMAILNTK